MYTIYTIQIYIYIYIHTYNTLIYKFTQIQQTHTYNAFIYTYIYNTYIIVSIVADTS